MTKPKPGDIVWVKSNGGPIPYRIHIINNTDGSAFLINHDTLATRYFDLAHLTPYNDQELEPLSWWESITNG